MLLRRSLSRSLTKGSVLFAVICAFTVPAELGGALLSSAGPEAPVSHAAPEGSPRWFVERHGCWTGAAPTGVVAHHAVVTVDGVTRYVGQRVTDRAIEQAVFGVDHGLIVHGFCR